MGPYPAIRWRLFRVAYYAGLVALFLVIGLYLGPNYVLFGKFTWITTKDFVRYVERDGVPVVAAMKAYQRDHGRLPRQGADLVPDYLAEEPRASIWEGQFELWSLYNHMIHYDFTPGHEGWSVQGVFVSGPIPAPPVPPAPPSTRPTTHPKKSAATRAATRPN